MQGKPMQNTEDQHSGQFWIDEFKVDPHGLRLYGAAGAITLEPKVMQVLMALAAKPGELVLRDELMDEVWAVEYGSDESLTRAISVLRKSFSDVHGRRTIIETVPRRGYRLIGTVSRDGPAVGSTSVDEAQILDTQERKSVFQRQILAIVGVIFILAIAAYVFIQTRNLAVPDKVVVETHTVITNRVYVSPFETQNQTADIEAFAASLVPQISSLLSANGVLTSLDDKTDQALQEFDLEGEVDETGDGLRITVRLIDHRTQLIIWSNVFMRPRDQMDIFGREVAAGSATVITCILNMRTDAYATKTETLILYARFCNAYARKRYTATISDFKSLTEPIYRAEPNNPKAMALHAWALSSKARFDNQFSDAQKEIFRRQSKDLVDAAIAADPNAYLANFLRANTIGWVDNWAAVEKLIIPAASQYGMPDFVYQEHATLLQAVGRLKDATSVFEKMLASNPSDIFSRTQLGWLYATQNRPSESEQQFALVARYDPDSYILRERRLHVDLFLGNAETASLRIDGMRASGRRNMAQTITCFKVFLRFKWFDPPDSDVLLTACTGYHPIWQIRLLTGIRDLDRAYNIADEYDWASHDAAPLILFYADMAAFRRDPRFWRLVEKIGLVSYWQETGKWPDFCENDDLPVDCKTSAARVTASVDFLAED